MNSLKEKTAVFLATGGFIGYAPVAPGTFGTLAALPLCFGLALLPGAAAIFIVFALTILSIWLSSLAASLFGQNDPKPVVIDEICGMAIALAGIQFTAGPVVLGFVLFRFFDILKPFPIRWVDRNVAGGLGIMLDDILAGLFTNILVRVGMALLY